MPFLLGWQPGNKTASVVGQSIGIVAALLQGADVI